ncbi:MAG: hypothetical protein DMD69_08920 [Gemmatimonadetes bacterium]|nr:MAG: hypothetical protein DMD69_08920 [Gemmatimonadota bacterium]
MWRLFLFLCAAGLGVRPLGAQARASFGVGVGTVRDTGGTTFSSGSFSPTLHFASPTVSADVSSSFASLPGGVWSSQGRGDLWLASRPIRDGWRIGVEGILAGISWTDGGWTAAAHGIGELLWSRPRWGFGVGAGPSAGWIANESSTTALHTRARVWWRPGGDATRADWQLTIEPTRLPEGWFTDAAAQVTLTRGPAIAAFWAAARISRISPSTAAGSAALQFFVSPSIALEAGGGSYLKDPYQGLPRAAFLTLGVRLYTTPAAPAAPPKGPQWSPLVPDPRGDSLVVRFRFESVRSVAIAGDWNQWQPMPLHSLGANLWEGALVLRRGLYHFNLLVDGNDWVVPNGVAAVPDGLGGMVGVLLVP